MRDRFSKSVVRNTIARLRQATEAEELWKQYPGVREGRLAALTMAETLATEKWARMSRLGYGSDLRTASAQLCDRHKIAAGSGCAQTRNQPIAFAHAYGEFSALCDLIAELEV